MSGRMRSASSIDDTSAKTKSGSSVDTTAAESGPASSSKTESVTQNLGGAASADTGEEKLKSDTSVDTTKAKIETAASETETTEAEAETTESKTETTAGESETTEDKTETESEITEGKTEATAAESETTEGKTEPTEVKTEIAAPESETTEGKTETTAVESETAEGKTETTAAESETPEDKTEIAAAESETPEDKTETTAAESETAEGMTEATAAESETAEGKTETTAAESETAEGKTESTAAESETAEGKTETTAEELETAEGKTETTAAEPETAEGKTESTAAESETAEGTTETTAAESETAEGKTETTAAEPETAEGKTESTAAESETAEGTTETTAAESEAGEGKTETLAAESETRESKTESPEGETKPAGDENEPAAESETRESKTESPEGETKPAGDESEPAAESSEPPIESTLPPVKSSQSEVEPSQPEDESSQPEVEPSEPPVDTSSSKPKTIDEVSPENKLDIIVFGATGFTGRQTVVSMIGIGNRNGLAWGVAARNKKKLFQMLYEISNKTGTDITRVPKFHADIGDDNSLSELASYCRVLINCCGPFRFLGEPVVKACIAAGTHHIDISGEPQYMEQMQLKYHKEAEEKGVYIISACGFDSLVAEMGIIYMMDNFPGQLNSVETYLETEYTGRSHSGAGIHYGTWESAVYSYYHSDELRPLREQLYPEHLPALKPKLSPRSLIHRSSIIHKWCLPFPGSDRSIALRTQRHFYDVEKQRPLQVQTYIAFSGFFKTLIFAIICVIFGYMVKSSFTRRLLLNFPRLFSFGMVSHKGPSDEARANTLFHMTFYGQGWSEKKPIEEDTANDPPNSFMTIKLSGQDPGYGFTSDALILSASTVLVESSLMPGNGGVYPPGAAFAKTSLLKLLQDQGLKVEVIGN